MHALEILLDAIAKCELPVDSTHNLAFPKEPSLYVPPTFHYVENYSTLESDAVFVQAPAAVGKSMTAKYISARKNAPILDLAKVPVGTDSLRGMIGNDAAIDAFRKGNLPIIVDAMDEGRLISGEQSFEQFLASTGKLLADTSNPGDCKKKMPKIVFFGRPESADFASVTIQLVKDDLSLCKIELDYFGRKSALELIDRSAEKEIDRIENLGIDQKSNRKSGLNGIPMNNLKNSYFNAIASALELSNEDLWTDKTGQSFAGYAPVLSTLAIMIAGSDNPHKDRQELESGDAGQAWDVVSKVLRLVMKREQRKLRERLVDNIHGLSEDAYSEDEQLSYLAQVIQRTQIRFSGEFSFERNGDKQRYMERISVFLKEHPFVRDGKAANDVLGAAIAAHAILTGISKDLSNEKEFLGGLSRQPFIWRHFTRKVLPDTLIDGHTMGYLLNSYFNDPLVDPGSKVRMRDNDEGGISVHFVTDDVREDGDVRVDVMPPVTMVQRARNCDIDIADKLVIDGPRFLFSKTNSIMCGELELRPGTIGVHGELTVVVAPGGLRIEESIKFFKDDEASISLSSDFHTQWPSQHVDYWIKPPVQTADPVVNDDVLNFIHYLGRQTNRVVVLSRNYHLSTNEKNQQWRRVYNWALPYSRRFMRIMVDLGIAKADPISAGTAIPIVRITFNDVDWDLMAAAFSGQSNTYSELYDAVYRLNG